MPYLDVGHGRMVKHQTCFMGCMLKHLKQEQQQNIECINANIGNLGTGLRTTKLESSW